MDILIVTVLIHRICLISPCSKRNRKGQTRNTDNILRSCVSVVLKSLARIWIWYDNNTRTYSNGLATPIPMFTSNNGYDHGNNTWVVVSDHQTRKLSQQSRMRSLSTNADIAIATFRRSMIISTKELNKKKCLSRANKRETNINMNLTAKKYMIANNNNNGNIVFVFYWQWMCLMIRTYIRAIHQCPDRGEQIFILLTPTQPVKVDLYFFVCPAPHPRLASAEAG